MSYCIFVNEWISITEDGLWESPFEDGKISWKTKRDLVYDIASAKWDVSKIPKIKRIGTGRYYYVPKNSDDLADEYSSGYLLVRLTSMNIHYYRQLLPD